MKGFAAVAAPFVRLAACASVDTVKVGNGRGEQRTFRQIDGVIYNAVPPAVSKEGRNIVVCGAHRVHGTAVPDFQGDRTEHGYGGRHTLPENT